MLQQRKTIHIILLIMLFLTLSSCGGAINNGDTRLMEESDFHLYEESLNLEGDTQPMRESNFQPSEKSLNVEANDILKTNSRLYVDSHSLTIETGDGLKLELSSSGGAVNSVISPAGHLESLESIYKSGFFVRDVARHSDFFPLGGNVQAHDDALFYSVADDNLGIDLQAIFTGYSRHIDVDINLTDLTNTDRALTIYFALPLNMEGWTWGDNIRKSRNITGSSEFINSVNVGFGSNGIMSRYPIAAVSGKDGIAIGYPLDNPATIRLVANPSTNQLYIAYDVALSELTKQPGKANLKAVIYRFDPVWGFRSAIKKYYEIYPDFFVKRVNKEGIWVAFSDLENISDIEDFGIAFHEGNSNLIFADNNNILSLRYLGEPQLMWFGLPDDISNMDYDQVISNLFSRYNNGSWWLETVPSSGIVGENGEYSFDARQELGWCQYCSLFYLNADPDIYDSDYPLSRANLKWNEDKASDYSNISAGVLDGEYIDSFEIGGENLDYKASHLKAADLPLVYNSNSFRPAVPIIFSTYEFVKSLGSKIHEMGKLMMANWILHKFAFPVHVFDIPGSEVFLQGKCIEPFSDSSSSFWRTMSYRKPYVLLLSIDVPFSEFSRKSIEDYMRASLFYGLYPGIFLDSNNKRYWDDPSFYERDRDLFKKYVPLIQTLSEAGWNPVTNIRSSDSKIYVERYGYGESLYITTRSGNPENVSYLLNIEADKLGLPAGKDIPFTDLISGDIFTAKANGENLIITDKLKLSGVRMFHWAVSKISIDIKPGTDLNSINLSSSGVIPVAILSSDIFDATMVDPETVRLAGARVKVAGKSDKYLSHEEDVNGDGLLDLLFQVSTTQFTIEPDEGVAILYAETFDGITLRGEDTVNIILNN